MQILPYRFSLPDDDMITASGRSTRLLVSLNASQASQARLNSSDSHPRILCVYHGVPTILCLADAYHWLLKRIRGDRTEIVDQWCILFRAAYDPTIQPGPRHRMEIVS